MTSPMRTPMRILALSLLLLLSSFSARLLADAVVLDRVAAIVDEGVVMESDLRNQLRAIKIRMQAQGAEMPPDRVLQAQVLEHLIVQELQMQIAERAEVTASDEEVNAALLDMQRSNNLTYPEFRAQLQAQGMTIDDLKAEIHREMIINRVQRGVLSSRMEITDQMVEAFLNSREGQFWTEPEYHLGHILVPLPGGASEEAIATGLEKAEELRGRALAGDDFGRLATVHSAGQNALEGGDLGWRKPAQLPELFATHLTGLDTGDISEPFRSGAGFHLLKVVDKRGGGGESLIQQTKVRHILLQPSVILTDQQAEQQLLDIRQQILDGADFAEMAREHSKDPGSMLAGGDLGWAMPGMFVPEFEATMESTQIGEISMPFQTQHGWHILQVEDRRMEDMSDTMIRNQARNLLRNRRFEEELPIWLQEIRDNAYVDIKLSDIDTVKAP